MILLVDILCRSMCLLRKSSEKQNKTKTKANRTTTTTTTTITTKERKERKEKREQTNLRLFKLAISKQQATSKAQVRRYSLLLP